MKEITAKRGNIMKIIQIDTGFVILEDYRAYPKLVSNVYILDREFNEVCTVKLPGNLSDIFSNIWIDGYKVKGLVTTGLEVTIDTDSGSIYDWVAVK